MIAILNPFHALATWLVSLLPAGSGELATGTAAMLGIVLVLLAIVLPFALLGMILERRERRSA